MSAIQVATAAPDIADRRIPWGRLRDTSAVIKRNLLQYLRVPQLLVFSTIQPITGAAPAATSGGAPIQRFTASAAAKTAGQNR